MYSHERKLLLSGGDHPVRAEEEMRKVRLRIWSLLRRCNLLQGHDGSVQRIKKHKTERRCCKWLNMTIASAALSEWRNPQRGICPEISPAAARTVCTTVQISSTEFVSSRNTLTIWKKMCSAASRWTVTNFSLKKASKDVCSDHCYSQSAGRHQYNIR